MKKINMLFKIFIVIVTVFSLNLIPLSRSFAESTNQDGCASTSILDGCWQIEDILNLILTTLTIGAGVMATGSIIVAGVIYATARDNASQVQKAKTMIFNTVIGIIVYAFFWAIMQWLIPGGVGN